MMAMVVAMSIAVGVMAAEAIAIVMEMAVG